MNPATLIAALAGITQVATALVGLIGNAKTVFASHDKAAIDAAVLQLQKANDDLAAVVLAKTIAAEG